MRNLLFAAVLLVAGLTACGDPNHYDSHKGQEPDHSQSDAAHDTIQGRAPDSSVVVVDSTNTGIGDTTLERNH